MKRLRIAVAILGVATALAGCPRVERKPAAIDANQPILAVVRAQTDAMNKEDLEGALAIVDPTSPTFAQNRQLSKELFRIYDLRYTLREVAVESVKGAEATVRFTQITEKVSGPQFRDNRIEGVHLLKKQADGGWKIFTTRAEKIDYLEKDKP